MYAYSTVGYSNTQPFTLVLCRDAASHLDALEINDSPYSPSSVPLSAAGWNMTSVNLNVPNDQDWLLCDTTGYEKVTATIPQNCTVDMYSITGNGNQMQLCPATISGSNKIFEVPEGYCYIRIGNALDVGSNDFSTAPYTLHVEATPIPTTPTGPFQFTVEMNGDQGQNSYVNYGPYVDYAEGFDRKFRYRDTISPTVTVRDANGNPVEGVTVRVVLVSSFWSEASGNQVQYYSSTQPTGADGSTVITISPPATAGTYSILLDDGPHIYRHHVDIDLLYFYVEGMDGAYAEDVYRLAYSEYVSS